MNRYLFVIIGLLLNTSFAPALTIETFGDSLTQGVFSKTSIIGSTPQSVSKVLSDASMFVVTKDSQYLFRHGSPETAWPKMMADQFEEEPSISVNNFAVGGERTSHLLAQVKKVNYTTTPNTKAFFFMGHNDLCPNLKTDIDKLVTGFVSNYKKALEHWDSMHHGATAYIVPIGNVDQVFEMLLGFTWYQSNEGQKFQCDTNWTLYFPFCPALHKLALAGKIRDVLTPRIKAMNEALGTLVDDVRSRSRDNHFHFLSHVSELEYKPSYFAADCFHLSPNGQLSLAKSVLEEVRRR